MSRSQSPIRRHATMNVTFQIYAHRSTGQDRTAAEQITQAIAEALGSER